jgi:hypothetical protein
MRFDAVLFDLDGTLVDSAPDLAGAANDMRRARPAALALREPAAAGRGGRARHAGAALRPVARAMTTTSRCCDEFLACTSAPAAPDAQSSTPCPVLDALRRSGLPWGIVTNKACGGRAAGHGLALHRRARCWWAATARRIPSRIPAPLLEAAAPGLPPGAASTWATTARRAGRPRRRHGHRGRRLGLPGPGRPSLELGRRCHVLNSPDRALELARTGLNSRLLGPTWLRRGCGVGAGHAEHQFARKSTGNKVTANDTSYALAA